MRKIMKVKSAKKRLREECTDLLRQIVFIRDKNACIFCGTTKNLQLSHIYPKGRYRCMEHDPENAKCLCLKHHLFYWHRSPVEAWERLQEVLPRARLDRLKLASQTTQRVDLKLTKLYLEKELEKVKKTRLV